ncbi:MAG: transporter [Calditrichia bacterium]
MLQKDNLTLFLLLSLFSTSLFAGGWTQPKGQLWLKSSLLYQSTDKRFCHAQDATSLAFQQIGCNEAGHSTAFDPFIGGKLTATGLFTEAAFGITDRLEAGLQVPWYRLEFTNFTDPERSPTSGIGDIRLRLKWQTSELPVVSAIELIVKSPTGEFSADAEVVNVSEGQWDYEIRGEVSRSFWPVPLYVGVGIGYRVRTDNDSFEQSIGNEFLLRLEAGYQIVKKLQIKADVDWLRGARPTLFATKRRVLWRRELLTASPVLVIEPIRNLQIETGVRLSIAGEDFPAGSQLQLGFRYRLAVH